MLFLIKTFALICLLAFALGANLPADEVASLQLIARTLGKRDWDFSVDPCSGESGWVTPNTTKFNTNAVNCNCTFLNNTTCHVVSIILKAQNLAGTVPRELVRLPFLEVIDLARNYLNGTIPAEWGSMKLVNKIALDANRVTGPIPRELANINTLVTLTLDYNQLTGTIPPQLGNLPHIETISINSNYLTGELPENLGRLTTLKEFRISDNNFTGRIPNFITNWRNVENISIQGTGLTGPIPSGIAFLTNLTDLRISDLNGNESISFPPLVGVKKFKTLILRSCNIVGRIPPYIGQMTTLSVLDLSFNKLSGPLPEGFERLEQTHFIYLTGNSLSGPLPAWMLNEAAGNIDLSYNNFTIRNQDNCQPMMNLNLFASSKGNTPGAVSCLRSCERTYNSLHINCGGPKVTDNGATYDDDGDSGGPSNVFQSSSGWAFSSTGHFLDDNHLDPYILRSSSANITGQNPELYLNARISPLSLTYYGFCLKNGSYKINLHFAEIRFTNDTTYSSHGRRIFDVYIQGKIVLKDFNIKDAAGGVNKAVKKNFIAVVTDSTLDIRFYWAGKGTTGIPVRGVYGPLISAISVDPNYKLPSVISTGSIVGIVLGALLTGVLVLGVLRWKGFLRKKNTLQNDLKGLGFQTGSYTLRQIKAATNNFDVANKIGEGGFGPVYKGLLSDGTVVAVKQLSSQSKQGNREFVNEIGMISALQHPHLVKLHGCCMEGNQLLLIYEYLENNSLARALFGPEEHQLSLDWSTRHKICIGMARGLAYLHEESRLKIVHRDIKATNVLLDKNFSPKISDFGLAKLDEDDSSHISTRVAGTLGYMAPEYAMRGYLTDKADVYSFGVVLLEVVSGRSNTSIKSKAENLYLLDWANSLKGNGNLMELVDPRLESKFDEEEVLTAIKVALLCTNVVAAERPNMSAVVSMLEGRAGIDDFVPYTNVSIDDAAESNDGQALSISMDVTWTSSSSPTADLYPIHVDTAYWEKRGY